MLITDVNVIVTKEMYDFSILSIKIKNNNKTLMIRNHIIFVYVY